MVDTSGATDAQESFHIDVHVTEDRMAVRLDCTVPAGDLNSLVARIQQTLASFGIIGAPEAAQLAQWLRENRDSESRIRGRVLVQGRAPVPPENGEIEWAADFFSSGFVVDEKTGQIDYRRHAAQRSVAQGQLLARVLPPKLGQDGIDVFGKRVRVTKPRPARLRAGEHVREEAVQGAFYAVVSGRLRVSGVGTVTVLAVDPVYHIEGCVGLETGDIEHPGALEVGKDILQGAKVHATGDIEVKQIVEAADIETGGNLTVRGGIMGGEGHKIRAEGSIHARFILDADIEAGGDVVVEREIVNSSVITRGAIVMPRGRLVGGRTVARGGMTVGQTGSEAAVVTVLTVCGDYRLEREIADGEKEMAALEETLVKQQAALKPFMPCIESKNVGALGEQPRQTLRNMLTKIQETKTQLDGLRTRVRELHNRAKEEVIPGIEVQTMVYPETVFCIGRERLQVRDTYVGPVRAALHEGQIELRAIGR